MKPAGCPAKSEKVFEVARYLGKDRQFPVLGAEGMQNKRQ